MKYSYYYGLVIDLILFSGFCTKTVNATNRNFLNPDANYTNWYKAGSDLCSMAIDYYNI